MHIIMELSTPHMVDPYSRPPLQLLPKMLLVRHSSPFMIYLGTFDKLKTVDTKRKYLITLSAFVSSSDIVVATLSHDCFELHDH